MSTAERLQLKLVTPVTTVFAQEVDGVAIPTTTGQITVLPNHTELVSILEPGELVVTDGNSKFPLAVSGGVLEVFNNTLYILADSAEHAHEIDLVAAEQRAQQLEQNLKDQTDLDLNSYSLLMKNLQMERARLAVGKKWKR